MGVKNLCPLDNKVLASAFIFVHLKYFRVVRAKAFKLEILSSVNNLFR